MRPRPLLLPTTPLTSAFALSTVTIALAVLLLVLPATTTRAQDGDTPAPAPADGGDTGDTGPGMRTNPAGDPETGDPGATIEPRGPSDTPPAATDTPAEPEKKEESDADRRARAERMAGWTFNRAIPRTHANVWVTQWNNDFKRFIHDLHAGFEFAFDVDEFRASVWTMLGVRFQASEATTGFDNWWLGGKLAIAGGGKGTFTVLTSIGLPIGKRIGDQTAIFSDQANGQLIGFQDINFDLGLAYALVGETAGLNVDVHLNLPIGLQTEVAFQGAAEVVVFLMDKDPGLDLHAGFLFSTAFTPFIPYGEVSLQLGDSMSFSGRVQFLLGKGPNFGNLADIMLFAIFDIRFGGPGKSDNGSSGGSGTDNGDGGAANGGSGDSGTGAGAGNGNGAGEGTGSGSD